MPRAIGFLDVHKQVIPIQDVHAEVRKAYRAQFTASDTPSTPKEEAALLSFVWIMLMSRSGATVTELIDEHARDSDDFIMRSLVRIRDALGAHTLSAYMVPKEE